MNEKLRKYESVEGIVFFGSYGRKKYDKFSDLDVIVYLNDTENITEEKKVVRKCVTNILTRIDENIQLEFYIYDKWVIFTENNLVKLEIQIKYLSKAREDIIYIAESRITSPEKAIVFDRNSRIIQIYKSNWIQLDNSERLRRTFKEEIYKFIYYYECFLSNIARNDEYKAYMNYTIAFYKLVGLKAIVEGEYYNLYQPRNFITEILKDKEIRRKYYETTGGLKKSEMILHKDQLVNLFFQLIKRSEEFTHLSIKLKQLKVFFTKIENRYL